MCIRDRPTDDAIDAKPSNANEVAEANEASTSNNDESRIWPPTSTGRKGFKPVKLDLPFKFLLSLAFYEALRFQVLKKELFPARFWGMSHFVKSSKGELMFAALALPRGWKSRLEPCRFQISHFVWGSCSEWLKNNVLYFLMISESTIGYRGRKEDWKETSARIALQNCNILNYFMCKFIIFVNFAVKR